MLFSGGIILVSAYLAVTTSNFIFSAMQGITPGKSRIRYLPAYGSISTGIIYLSIGIIAILSFLKIKDGGADESSLLAFLYEHVAGRVVFWVIFTGTVCYILWRIFETIKDPYGYGTSAVGIGKRAGIAMSTIPDILIVLTAVQVLAGTASIREDGRPLGQRQFVGNMLEQGWGMEIVLATGIVICITALVQFHYGITRGYKERLDIAKSSHTLKRVTHVLAFAGYLARGVIIGIIGFFFVKAALEDSGNLIVNTDKAFDFIGDHVGHVYFILTAIGTICYGIFMFILGYAYDADKD